jgi:hypothetical protein
MLIGEYVVVRTRAAGVHQGTLLEFAGTCVLLGDARRLWRWSGANTLHEVSLRGVAIPSRISKRVRIICLTEAIEVIPCTAEARANLDSDRWEE